MGQRLHTRSFRNHRDAHSPRLVALSGGDAAPAQPSRAEGVVRVLIAAGHGLVRAGYRTLLESEERIEVVGEAADRERTIGLAKETGPDVVLLDLGLPGLDDTNATTAIVSDLSVAGVAVMLIAPTDSDERVFDALRAGAIGVLATDAEPSALTGAVQLLAGGNALLPADTLRRLLDELPAQPFYRGTVSERLQELTDREREVVALAAQGLTNSEIAARLVISPATAKTHVSRAMNKLHARHRAELVVSAYEHGLVLPRIASGSHHWLDSPALLDAVSR